MSRTECTTWSGGQLFAFSGIDGQTSFESGLVLRSAFHGTVLNIVLPARASLTLFDVIPDSCRFGSDWLVAEAGGRRVSLVFVDAHTVIVDGRCSVEPAGSDTLSVVPHDSRTIVSVRSHEPRLQVRETEVLIHERTRWQERLRDDVAGAHPAAVKAASQIKGMIYAPEGRNRRTWSTPDRWPHRRMWLWDSAFHAVGVRHLDERLAGDIVSAPFDFQDDDGFIPHMMWPDGHSDITQPPVLGLGVAAVYEITGDTAWLDSLYRPLANFLGWIEKQRDTNGNGLFEWLIEEHENCRSGESGMDNSVRFDSGIPNDAVDFSCYLSHEYREMSRFASLLGLDTEAGRWSKKHETLNAKINELCWDEERGFYLDYDARSATRSPVEAVSGFLPLLCGAATHDRAERLVAALHDPVRFGTAVPIPSISVSDPGHTDDMWRGPTWINMNWLVARGLRQSGFADEADSLESATRECIESAFERHGTFFEYYDCHGKVSPADLRRKGRNDPDASPYHQVLFDYGWSATLYLDMVYRGI